MGEDITIEVVIKNASDQTVLLQTIPALLLSSQNLQLWSPLRLDAPANLIANERAQLQLNALEEKVLKYDLSQIKWDNQFSSVWPSKSLLSLISPGSYSVTYEIELEPFSPNLVNKVTSNAVNLEILQKNEQADYPASIVMSKAKSIAEDFMSKQYYKNAYEAKASSIQEFDGYVDCYFKRKIPIEVKGDGLVRVNKSTWKAEWIGSE